MGPAQFVEFLIVGLNLFLLIAFLAWRLLGPGRPNYAQPELDAGTEKDTSAGK